MRDTTVVIPAVGGGAEDYVAQDIALTLILLLGFSLKMLSSVWREARKNPDGFSLWNFLLRGPRKYRILGALELTVLMVFVVPDAIFASLMAYEAGGHRVGNIAVFGLGFIADEIFVLLHLFNDKVMGALADRLGIDRPDNGKKKDDPPSPKERKSPDDL